MRSDFVYYEAGEQKYVESQGKPGRERKSDMKRRWGMAVMAACMLIGAVVGTAYGAEVLVGVDDTGTLWKTFRKIAITVEK